MERPRRGGEEGEAKGKKAKEKENVASTLCRAFHSHCRTRSGTCVVAIYRPGGRLEGYGQDGAQSCAFISAVFYRVAMRWAGCSDGHDVQSASCRLLHLLGTPGIVKSWRIRHVWRHMIAVSTLHRAAVMAGRGWGAGRGGAGQSGDRSFCQDVTRYNE